MNYDRGDRSRGAGRVREPVQVYLDRDDQERLDRLTHRLDTSKSDVLRRGLAALEQQVTNPSEHPALRIVGLVRAGPDDAAYDIAREHDRFLAETEEALWTASRTTGSSDARDARRRPGPESSGAGDQGQSTGR